MADEPGNREREQKCRGEAALFVVATPIGNLQDLSPRARSTLATAAVIAAEDTRRTARLLSHCEISTPVQSLHEHNEERVAPRLLDRIAAGEAVALVSDAGTPLISDPGYRLVRAAHVRGLPVRTVPGPSAVTAALSVAGLPTDRFVFEGFLPPRAAARRQRLEALAREERTLVLFEASHRIVECMDDLAAILGGARQGAVCRELSKRFETVHRATLEELAAWLRSDPDQQRGEFVLVVEGAAPVAEESLTAAVDLARTLLEFLPASQAARAAAKVTGARRQAIYAALEQRESRE